MLNHTRKSLTLSVKDKNLDPSQNTHFTTASFVTSQLKDVFLNKNYSSIVWRGNRLKANFDFAHCVLVDIDHELKIEDAGQRLKSANLNYTLITTKRHTAEAHRFRILIPITRIVRTAEDYERILRHLKAGMFPELDNNAIDGAHFFYGSPTDAIFSSFLTGNDYDPDENLNGQIPDAWNESLFVKKSDGQEVIISYLQEKTPIYCPFHEDQNQSAFFEISNKGGKKFIRCSACDKNYWMIKPPLPQRCARYWSHSTDIYECGIADDTFYMEKITKEKFLIFVGAANDGERASAYKYLVDNKHISHLKLINHIGEMSISRTMYEVDQVSGIITVKYSPVAENVKNNQAIEEYLGATFGQYKDFIKQWLAVYCYTNYQSLPTLILKGGRGTGKNTFAEMVKSIFPSISQMWEGKKGNFTSEVEKKLLIADETVCDDPEQYKLLKQYAGSKYTRVNKKFKPEYEVLNNMNIIILSNSAIPIYVTREEKPKSESNNQFFVHDFKPFEGPIDPKMNRKLEACIGHYIRTELKTVYDNLKFDGHRYSISTPITPEEAGLFESNMTEEEHAAEKVIDMISLVLGKTQGEYEEFLKEAWLPKQLLNESISVSRLGPAKVVRGLREQGYIEMQNSEKKQIKNNRFRCYKMTKKLVDAINEPAADGKGQQKQNVSTVSTPDIASGQLFT
jgi:hypothetical protein